MASQPKYQRIARELRDGIESGEYGPGDRLPGENELMATYGVARMTARQALAVLREAGLTETRKGAGVFVLPSVVGLGHARVVSALGKPPVAITHNGSGSPRSNIGEAMIFGGEATSAQVGTEPIRVRALEPDEVRNLGSNNLIFVQDHNFADRVLVPAYRMMNDAAYLDRQSDPMVHVRSIFGSQFHVSASTDVFEQDDLGEEMPVIRSAGTRITSALFFTGLSEDDALERLKRALRNEFGPGVVEVWNMRSAPVRDLRWDVYATRTAWLPKEGSRKGKSQEGSYEVVEKKLLARGVRDGHERYFMNKAEAGWQVVTEPHQPDTSQVEVL